MARGRDTLKELLATERPVIGMVHFPPLPGTALYDDDAGVKRLDTVVEADVGVLVDAGFDALLFCNEGDRPYSLDAPREAVATMSAVIARRAPDGIPFGVDFLWDPLATLAIGQATGASFVREVFTGAYESDMGLWSPSPSQALRYRKEIGAEHLRLFMNITPEFASPLGKRPLGLRARSAVINGLADAILISGPAAGSEADPDLLEEVKTALDGGVPVLVNTGVKQETVGTYLDRYDGVIVGTAIKVDGHTWNPVDPERAKALIRAASGRQTRASVS
jgi:membrane complex biogenesis BtpA family protein